MTLKNISYSNETIDGHKLINVLMYELFYQVLSPFIIIFYQKINWNSPIERLFFFKDFLLHIQHGFEHLQWLFNFIWS